MSNNELLHHLRELEVALHQPGIRSAPDRLDYLLHESFFEIGRSGRSYSKTDVMRQLQSEQLTGAIWSQDFSVAEMADGVALLIYKQGLLDENAELSRHTLRSSIWLLTQNGWQMRFHQGTATEPYEKAST